MKKLSHDTLQRYLYDLEGAYYYKDGRKYAQSVHGRNYSRLAKAREQARLQPIPVEEVVDLIVMFLEGIGIDTTPLEIPSTTISRGIDYKAIAAKHQLEDARDLVWIKIASNGTVGVVATSADLNLQLPSHSSEYDARTPNNGWQYNTAGIIVHSLGLSWLPFAIVFPLPHIPEGYTRHEIEHAVGNYLIEKHVPLLDYYSHCY